MKKNIKTLIGILLLTLVAASCENYLDEQPQSAISDAGYWNTNDDAELGIAAVYDALQDTYKTKHFYWGEFRSDNLVTNSGNASDETGSMITNSLSSQYEKSLKWDDFYKAVSRANIAIEKIPTITNYDQNLLGEAYAIRAYLYFDAYRVWGGVPIFRKPVTKLNESAYVARSTASEVLDLVLDDMATASKLITKPTDQFRFSVASISAFKAKVHMHLKMYTEASADIEVIMKLGKFSLVKTRQAWTDMFRTAAVSGSGNAETGSELIFSIRNTQSEDGDNAAQHHIIFFPGVPKSFISPIVMDKWIKKFPIDQIEWEAKYPGIDPPVMTAPITNEKLYGDWRYYETVDQTILDGNFRTSKYHLISGNSKDDDTDIVIFRYSDILLLKAILENEKGNSQTAISLMNEIRVARQLPLVKTSDFTNVNDKNEMLNYILDERQLELFAEGTRWWDLLSNDKAIEVMNETYKKLNDQAVIDGTDKIYNVPLTTENSLWPIFIDHLIDNDKLVQNPAYSN